MNVLDLLSSTSKSTIKNVIKPSLEDQCPNLALVRKYLGNFIVGQEPVPDCEINYELGYVYDPLYKAKDWLCSNYNMGDEWLINKLSNFTGELPIGTRRFLFWSQKAIDPWNSDKYTTSTGDCANFIGWNYEELLLYNQYKDACVNKDWASFIVAQSNTIEAGLEEYGVKPEVMEYEPIPEELLNLQLRDYFKYDVLESIGANPGRGYEIKDVYKYNCDVGDFKGFEFYTFKRAEQRGFDSCFEYGNPEITFQYEKSIIKRVEAYNFWSAFGTREVNAKTCFDLYNWICRHGAINCVGVDLWLTDGYGQLY